MYGGDMHVPCNKTFMFYGEEKFYLFGEIRCHSFQLELVSGLAKKIVVYCWSTRDECRCWRYISN